MGSGGPYHPDYLLDKDIVLVTINYRLGVLGESKKTNLNLVFLLNPWQDGSLLLLELDNSQLSH